jgi:hypothetical protein
MGDSLTNNQQISEILKQRASIKNSNEESPASLNTLEIPGVIIAGKTTLKLNRLMYIPILSALTFSVIMANTIDITADQPMPHVNMPR